MTCQLQDCQTHYGCRLRAKGLQVSPRVNSTATRNWTPSYTSPPAHYRKPLTVDVPGGFQLPVMRMDGKVIRHREAERDHHKINDQMQQTQAWAAQQ